MIKKHEWLLLIFNLLYIIPFTIYYIFIKNYEFLIYIAVLVILFFLIIGFQRKIKFDNFILWGVSIWGLLHMAGGGVKIGEGVLYGLHLIPIWMTENFFILRYDQFVHFYLYVFMSLIIFHLLKPSFSKKANNFLVYLFVLTASVGVGAFNEIIEFSTVLFFENTGVGGYYNTAWDLVFNTLGALLGVLIAHFRR